MSQLVSVVVPVFNNQPTLEETCRQIMEVHQSSFGELELEVIFVNDGSTDGSWQELERLQRLHKETVSLINLSRNFGQLGALYAGFNHARGDAVICVSADLQDPIQLMGKMVAYWRSGTEIVICYREKRDDGFLARKSSNLAYSIARIANPGLPSIRAALYPAHTDYLYFVARNDGTHIFSRSFADHQRAIAEMKEMRRANPPPP